MIPCSRHHQILFQQDDVRRLLGNVHCGVHRDADVCGFHGSGIVDAVTHKAHGVAIFPQHRHNPCLLIRGELGKNIGGFRCPGQLGIAHVFEIRSQQHIAHLQPHLLADGAGNLVVVPGQDFGRHAMILQSPDGIRSGLLGRVKESQIADQHHITLVLDAECPHRRGIALLRDAKHTESLIVEAVHCPEDTQAHLLSQRPDTAVTPPQKNRWTAFPPQHPWSPSAFCRSCPGQRWSDAGGQNQRGSRPP